ncbi:LysM peptidoglycan-binding domain-containing protein [Pseudonocardia xinjiangensis]|uniref:LysM peptidoglycan-binding domain-containing protein n=1 Tax=Pseudonocardia xinjiangensis TaxID=75289 RepID=UPI003D93FA5D
MIRVRRLVTSVAAAAAVLAILFGLPVLLWLLARQLLPAVLPSGLTPVDILLRPDDGTLLVGFLVLVGTCAWLVLAVSIITELVATLAHRAAPRIGLPGFRLGHSIAAALVAAMLSASPAIAAPVSAVALATVASEFPTSRPSVNSPERTEPVHIVKPRDTLWRIAETSLGDPLRWREIYDLNVGRIQPDGGRLTEASVLVVGWQLTLPDNARDRVQVEPGDTLTELAADYLGDPSRADELFAANTATPQPGGVTLTQPDLLQPGWTLLLPESRPPNTAPPPLLPAPNPSPTATAEPVEPPASPSPPPAPPSELHTSAPNPGTAAPTATPPAQAENGESNAPALTIVALGVSSVVVGGLLTRLAVRRRRQLRHRPPHHRIAVPADVPGRIEWSASDHSPTTAVTRLDLALRSLALANYDGIAVPALRSVRLTAMDTLITLAGRASMPPPFVAIGEQDDWTLDADAALPVPAEEASGRCAPFPTLVSIATDNDRTLLVDLEERAVLRIGGNRSRARALLRHIAAELATSRIAEDTEVLLVDLGDDLEELNPDQIRAMPDLETALTEIEDRASATSAAAERLGMASVVQGRLRDIAADSWLPTVLLIGREPGQNERARLEVLEAAARGTTAVSVVVLDPPNATLHIGADGGLDLSDIDDGPWHAAQLTDNAGTHLAAILGPTAEPPLPVGPAVDPQPWAAGMQEDGSLDDNVDEPAEEVDEDGEEKEAPPPADSTAPPLRPPADPEAARRLAIVEHQDPHLDDDLARWHQDGPPVVPMIAILGEPAVRAPGAQPTARPSWFAEVLVYLSLHPAGVTAAKAVTDLWPDGHRISPATIRHAFYGARRWAGRGLGGDSKATFVSDMQNDSTYRLRGHLLDWDLFRRLRKRGQARHSAGHPDAVADYEAALALVRGPVLSALRPGGYAWLNNHDQRHDLQIPGFIVDAAHELVDIALANGDTGLARRAAEQARLVDIDVAFDRPLTDLMRVAHAEDNRAELELYAAVLLDARGFEVPEELASDSFAVLNELLPAGPRRPRS